MFDQLFKFDRDTTQMGGIDFGSLPIITLLLSGVIAVIASLPGGLYPLETLSFNYLSVMQGEYWRLLTAHLVHSSSTHLFWDLLAFSVCAAYVEISSRKLLIQGVLIAWISVNVWLLSPFSEIMNYSGVSGVLICIATIACWQWHKENPGVLGWIPIVVIVVKTLLEQFAGEGFVGDNGWNLYPEAHLVGIISGFIIIAVNQLRTGDSSFERRVETTPSEINL